MLCNDLERWDTQEEREIYIYRYTHMHIITDLHCCTAETNTTV